LDHQLFNLLDKLRATRVSLVRRVVVAFNCCIIVATTIAAAVAARIQSQRE